MRRCQLLQIYSLIISYNNTGRLLLQLKYLLLNKSEKMRLKS